MPVFNYNKAYVLHIVNYKNELIFWVSTVKNILFFISHFMNGLFLLEYRKHFKPWLFCH